MDVAHGMLDSKLRNDPRVVVLERTNVRNLDRKAMASLGEEPFDVVVADLSFISLTAVARMLVGELAAPGADVVLLVKPQFEVGRAIAARGRGVVKGAAERRGALERVAEAVVAAGARIMGAMASPLLGPAGNAEFLLRARAHAQHPPSGTAAILDAAIAEAPDHRRHDRAEDASDADGSHTDSHTDSRTDSHTDGPR